VNTVRNNDLEKRSPSTHQHFHPPNHLPDLRRLLPAARILSSRSSPSRIHDTPLHLDGVEREELEGEVPGGV